MAGFEMRRRVLEEHPRGRVVMVDTIAHVAPEDAGHVVVAGSHGGVSSGEYAARVPVAAVFFNDAGGGKDDAGRAALPYLDERGYLRERDHLGRQRAGAGGGLRRRPAAARGGPSGAGRPRRCVTRPSPP
ncbi:MAG: hypothetical protein K0S06_4271 [Microvirga sp.]|nr:hypothetical protein [Microvirga sp.]